MLTSSFRMLARATAIAAVLWALAGCTSSNVRHTPQPDTTNFVNLHMTKTMTSIDQSLKTLLQIERGGEGPRRPQPLGATVAGAAAPNAHPATTRDITPAGDPAKVQRHADKPPVLPNDKLPERLQAASLAVLDECVQLHWDGTPDALLAHLSSVMGFTFDNEFLHGHHKAPRSIHVDSERMARRLSRENHEKGDPGKDVSIRALLEEVAYQTRHTGKIIVSLPTKTITFKPL